MVHLSCGQCRKIQPFSGDPPCCEVCGWSLNPPPVEQNIQQQIQQGTQQRVSTSDISSFKKIEKWFETTVLPLFVRAVGYLVLVGLGILALYFVVDWLTPEKEKLAEQYKISPDKVIVEPKPHGCDFDDAPLGNKHCHYEEEITPMRACDTCSVTNVYVSWRKVAE